MTDKNRYEIDWKTEIVATDGHWSVPLRFGLDGTLILRADTLEAAAGIAEQSLVDVDFFHPAAGVSASDPAVESGFINSRGMRIRSLDEDSRFEQMDEWNFERIDITAVRVAKDDS